MQFLGGDIEIDDDGKVVLSGDVTLEFTADEAAFLVNNNWKLDVDLNVEGTGEEITIHKEGQVYVLIFAEPLENLISNPQAFVEELSRYFSFYEEMLPFAEYHVTPNDDRSLSEFLQHFGFSVTEAHQL